jgi:ABC-2 type transport system permease protein
MDIILLFTKYKDLLVELIKREIKARYKQSILGYAWVVLVPLLNLVVLSLVFSYFIRIQTGNIPYAVYLFVGLVPWTFMSNSIAMATSSLVSNSSLITKITLPRMVFPFSVIFSKIIDFLLSLAILFIFLIAYGIGFKTTLIFLPLVFMVQLILVVGISLILSAVNVFFRDVENILGVFLMLWMYLTPIVYPPELVPDRFRRLFSLNPMVGIINSYRNIILYGVLPPISSFLYSLLFSLAIFIFGYFFFKKRAKYFADVI